MGRKVSRTARRADLLRTASQVHVPATCDVCVVGGGAAGLVAAIVAADKGAHVVALERDLVCGRTILATGNGRCNFANRHLDPKLYNDPPFVEATCGTSWLKDILSFFESCGLAWAEEAEGRLYPLSRQAASVRNVLLQRAREAGVVLAPSREVTRVDRTSDAFAIDFRETWKDGRSATTRAGAVIVCVGGAATDAYKGMGLRVAPPTPLLCPLTCEGPALALLDGRRVRATIRLCREKQLVAQESGEVLFRDYGLSGIAVFNLSRHAQPGDSLVLDLLPTIELARARQLAQHTLDGLLDPVVAQALVNTTGSCGKALQASMALVFTVLGTADTTHAQVRRGGLLTNQFEPATLEATNVPSFFACGEALDVDGPCGGFNLAWAWKSGMVAGAAAAAKEVER